MLWERKVYIIFFFLIMVKPLKLVNVGEGKAEIHEFQNDDKIDDEFIDDTVARLIQVVGLTNNQEITGLKTFKNNTVFDGNTTYNADSTFTKNTLIKTSGNTSITSGIYVDDILRWLHVWSHATVNNNYTIQRYNNTGTYLDTPFAIDLPNGNLWNKGRRVYDSGSNANGGYVRFGNGTQICFSQAIALTNNPTTTIYWTYPAPFSSGGICTTLVGWGAAVTPYISDGGTVTQVGFRAYDHTGAYVSGGHVRAISIGPWY